jgi:hypothetical protein
MGAMSDGYSVHAGHGFSQPRQCELHHYDTSIHTSLFALQPLPLFFDDSDEIRC